MIPTLARKEFIPYSVIVLTIFKTLVELIKFNKILNKNRGNLINGAGCLALSYDRQPKNSHLGVGYDGGSESDFTTRCLLHNFSIVRSAF